ncbi:hypothetical protein CVT24_004629 [Panaeolus cyanescens]|uniref:Formin GTPase-binding domain-containing protein n=1 Tax=Panaeolus cyanescens TaxID=181874 RepID=A0A409YSG5_9AGAR|nr:hypothetical protein CVT24_004629 [Panaeolus cyanescens]
MFKGILPSRRIPSGDFTIITNLVDNQGKENLPAVSPTTQMPPAKMKAAKAFIPNGDRKKKPDSKKPSHIAMPETTVSPQAFDKLLDDLQIPSSLRPKLYGMDASVKAAMLKSSQTMAISPLPQAEPTTPKSKSVRRPHSLESLTPQHPTLASLACDTSDLPLPPPISAHVSAHNSPYMSSPSRKASGHSRGLSFDTQKLFSRSQVNLASSSQLDLFNTNGGSKFSSKDKVSAVVKNQTPTRFCSLLQSTSSTQLDIEDVKKLRLLLRNESASWTEEFMKLGGYSALLTRLNEILEVEWREEQHDDQILHELLRCFKALSTSSIGCFALRSSCPTPFTQLVSLLYSDKKPGEVATRQLIVEMLQILFDLYPPSSLPSTTAKSLSGSPARSSSTRPREAWESQTSLVTSNLVTLPPPHKTFFSLIRSLLLTPAPPPAEADAAPVSPHEFIESLHVPRIYKTYLQELSDVCRDYFWVFCHPNNTIWLLSEVNESSAEKPRAPGGMTGGVEFEAMGYFTTHLKFVNSVAKCVESLNMPKEHEHSAWRFHHDLFLSGLERILLISRKASTTYYPTLHLELARYIAFAMRAGYELPYTIDRLIGLPPEAHCKPQQPFAPPQMPAAQPHGPRSGRSTPRHQPSTPTKRPAGAQAPALPSPRRAEPLNFSFDN